MKGNVRIARITEKTVPIKSEIRNAVIDFGQMTASVVAIVSDVWRDGKQLVGYGFNSNGRYAQGGLLRERFIPRLLSAEPATLLDPEGTNFEPARVWDTLMTNEKPGGHGERCVAVGVLDMAMWDLVAKISDLPLHALLAQRFGDGASDASVAVYAAGGYYSPDKGRDALRAEIAGYLELGYDTVKIKIGGAALAEDVARIETVLELLPAGSALAVDANGRFDLGQAIEYGEAMEPFGLRWYEEPGDPLDYALNAALAECYGPPLATGENIFSVPDARNLLRYAGLRPDRDVLQMDPALSYGLTEYLRMAEMVRERGWSLRQLVPHGGHQFALNIAAGLRLGGNESYPGVFQPFGGFADDTPVERGRVRLPDAAGIGLECKANLYALLREI